MGRLFEQGADVDPILTHRVASGLAGNTTKNHTWQKIKDWLNTVLQLPALQVTESTSRRFITDAERILWSEVKTKVIPLGVWDMDTTASININHGLTSAEFLTICDASCWVFNDDNDDLKNIMTTVGGVQQGQISQILYGIVNKYAVITRLASGSFDSVSYDSIAINRGYLKIVYLKQ